MAARIGRPPVSRMDFFNKISHMGSHRVIFVSPIRLADELGISSRTVRRMLKDLEADKFIKYEYREGNLTLIYSVIM